MAKIEPIDLDTQILKNDSNSTNCKRKRDNSIDDQIESELQLVKKEQKLTGGLNIEKAKTHKQNSELLSLKLKLDKQTNTEKDLLQANKAYKDEIVQLNKKLASYESLANDFIRIQKRFKAINQQSSLEHNKTSEYLTKNKSMPSNDLPTGPICQLDNNGPSTSDHFGTILNQRSAALQSTMINRSFLNGSNKQTEESIASDSEKSSGNFTDSSDASDYTKRNSRPLQRKTKTKRGYCNKLTVSLPIDIFKFINFNQIGKIIKEKMNEKQLEDFKQIFTYLSTFFRTKFNRNLRPGSIYKSAESYRFYMACTKYYCQLAVVFVMNPQNKGIHLLYKPLCNHAVLNESNGVSSNGRLNESIQSMKMSNDFKIAGKMKLEFIDNKIWNSMKSTYQTRVLKIEMSQIQLNELVQFENYIKNWSINKYNRKIMNSSVNRSKTGFSFYFICTKRNCHFSTKVFLNTSTKECEISHKNMCDHFADKVIGTNEESNFETSNLNDNINDDITNQSERSTSFILLDEKEDENRFKENNQDRLMLNKAIGIGSEWTYHCNSCKCKNIATFHKIE